MSKYSKEFKLEVIKYCIEGNHSAKDAMRKFNLPTKSSVLLWINRYKKHGIEGLFRNPKGSYSGDFKVSVIEYMHNKHLSLSETAIHFNLSYDQVVARWERIYYEEGPQAL